MAEERAKRVVLVGGSGYLGTGLRQRLVARGDHVTVIGRGAPGDHDGWRAVHWDGASLGSWTESLQGCDVVVHLAGKRVDCRPTRKNVAELISSREGTVRLVGQAVQGMAAPPTAWVQLSSLAIFGEGGEKIIDEASKPSGEGPRQMVEVCQRWEAAYAEAAKGIDRRVLLRPAIGIGGAGDPATARLLQLARLGLAGPIGSGQQWVSWIAAADFFDLMVRAVDDAAMAGLYHLTSPNPVRNDTMMAAYRAAVGRRFGMRSPRAITTMGAWLLGSDPALALTGRRCVPTRLIADGYRFITPNFTDAVARAVAV